MSNERPTGAEVERPLPSDGLPPRGPGGAHAAGARPGAAPLVALGATPRVSARCAWQVVADEAVVLDLQGRRVLGLNRVGSFVLPLLDGGRTVGGVAAMVAERFGVDVRRAEADVRVFLAELARRGFVEGVER